MPITEPIATRILRTTLELRMLDHQLRSALELAGPSLPLPEQIDPKIAAEFHDALDRMRHTLWTTALAAAAPTTDAAGAAVIGYRLSRVAEMLSTLRASGAPEVAELSASESFIEQVQAMAAVTLDKHLKKASVA
jgi:hypothetical protein